MASQQLWEAALRGILIFLTAELLVSDFSVVLHLSVSTALNEFPSLHRQSEGPLNLSTKFAEPLLGFNLSQFVCKLLPHSCLCLIELNAMAKNLCPNCYVFLQFSLPN